MRILRALLAVGLSLTIAVKPCTAFSDDTSARVPASVPERTLTLHPVELKYDEDVGIWYILEEHELILQRLTDAEKMEGIIYAQDKLIELQKDALGTSKALTGAQRDLALEEHRRAEDFKSLTSSQAREIEELRESKDSLIRSPILWFSVGALITSVVVFLIRGANGTTVVTR